MIRMPIEVDGNRTPSNHDCNRVELDGEALSRSTAFWASNGLEHALSNLERIQRTLVRTVMSLREDRTSEASRLLRHCLEGLDRMSETLSNARRALKMDFSQIQMGGRNLASLETDLIQLQDGIGSAWASEHFESLVDKLEYELLPHLAHWASFLRELSQRQSANE